MEIGDKSITLHTDDWMKVISGLIAMDTQGFDGYRDVELRLKKQLFEDNQCNQNAK